MNDIGGRPADAAAALAESARLRRLTVDAGSAPWRWSTVLSWAAVLLALGLAVDAELGWLTVLVVIGAAALGTVRAVSLRRTRASRAWSAALAATIAVALAADVAVQALVRGADLPLPNTWGAAAAALVLVLVARPVQARAAASLRR